MSVLDGLRSIFCRHLGHHRSCVTLVHALFPALDLRRAKVDLVGLGKGNLAGLQPTKVPLWDLTVAFVDEKSQN